MNLRREPLEATPACNCFPNSFGRPMLETGEYFDWSPAVDISETDQEYLIRAALPAVKKEDVKVTYVDGMLTLSGECRRKEEHKDDKHYRVENYYGDFSRSFALPEGIVADAISAESGDGVLSIHVPKAKPEVKNLTVITVQ
ncbi:MAG TPA: Hsp20/alpha crystallin family protein [Steroidobacteraceae bacterium]|nr:Hsp20/alpha crystallin family protein [Steroidobacteraceae bacterium]